MIHSTPLTVVKWYYNQSDANRYYSMVIEYNRPVIFRRAYTLRDDLHELPKAMWDWAVLHTGLIYNISIDGNNLHISFASRFDRDRFAARWFA